MSIKSWWNNLFQEPDLSTSGLPKVTCDVPMPKVKTPKPEKDISEPVLSFIEAYKANPKRFKVKRNLIESSSMQLEKQYIVYDSQLDMEFSASNIMIAQSLHIRWQTGKNTGWATEKELDTVYVEISKERGDRYKAAKSIRNSASRNRLTKLYKGE